MPFPLSQCSLLPSLPVCAELADLQICQQERALAHLYKAKVVSC